MRKALTLLLCSFAACSSGSSTGPGGNNGNNNGTRQGTFTAVIDGQSWVSTTNQTTGGSGSNQVPGLISISGTKLVSATNYTSLTLTLGYIAGPGTYPLGVNQGTTAGGTGLIFAPQGSTFGDWSTGFTGAAGTLTVTSLTSSRIGGTFQFTAPPQAFTSTTGTRVVTDGVFDMPLPASFTAAPAANKGSKVAAQIGGAAWNAATVVSLGANGVFGFTATTDSLSVSLTPGTVMSPGNSYPIGGQGGATMIAVKSGTSLSWTSAGGNAVGTISVGSYSGARATGTFSAALSGSGGALVFTNGTFDVRIDTP
jgi:hypothetical protein